MALTTRDCSLGHGQQRRQRGACCCSRDCGQLSSAHQRALWPKAGLRVGTRPVAAPVQAVSCTHLGGLLP